MATTVLFFDTAGRKVLRERTYETSQAAHRAMGRAAKRGQIAGIKATRTATDAPTCHH